jgi:capsular exopolysaccharide synthesis family protein
LHGPDGKELHVSDTDMQDAGFAQPVTSTGVRVKSGASHEIAQLWSSVCFSAERKTPKVLVVTSALRKEGVTQIAVALAVTGADSHSDLEIALVDFNVRDPQIAEILGLRSSPGVCEVLRQTASLEDSLVPVNIGNLSVLPAGQMGATSADLLRGDRLRQLVTSLADRFDHVIIDVPAANLYPEAQVLGGLADGVLMVVRTGVTRRESVAEARRRIEQAEGKIVGLVMNQRTYPIPGFIYRRM